jgi:tetratricopeptide (TPR) repeat protein
VHHREVTDVTVSPDGSLLAAAGIDGTIRVFHSATDVEARARKRESEPDDVGSPAASNERGDRLWQYGRVLEAEAAYREAVQRLEKLAAVFPDDSTYDQQMVRSLLSVGLLLQGEGKPDSESDSLLQRAQRISRTLSSENQRALDWSFRERSRNQADTGHVLQASRTRRQRMELVQGNCVVELMGAANSLATCADVTLPNPARAAELAMQADTLLKRVEDEQRPADIRIWLGCQLWHLSDVWVRLNDLTEAEDALQRARETFEKLATDYPQNHYYRQEISYSHRKLSDLMQRRGRDDDAERHLRESLAGYLQLVNAVPDSAFYRQEAAVSYWRLALLLRRGQRPEAQAALKSAAGISHDNAGLHFELGCMFAQRGEWGAAAACTSRAVNLHSENDIWWMMHAAFLLRAGEIFARCEPDAFHRTDDQPRVPTGEERL